MQSLLTALLLLAPADERSDKPVSFVHDVLPVRDGQAGRSKGRNVNM